MEKLRLKVHAKGRITIPVKFRKLAGIKEGDYIEALLADDKGELLLKGKQSDVVDDLLNVLKKAFPGKSTSKIMTELRKGWEK
ncbi:MAG: AbrB/MazE/SpoVT family DNA-binding domain-containing protein [Thermoproteota archaeon]